MKYRKNSLNEVIFHLKFSPLSEIYSNKKDAVSEFQKHIEKEFPEISFKKKKKSNTTSTIAASLKSSKAMRTTLHGFLETAKRKSS